MELYSDNLYHKEVLRLSLRVEFVECECNMTIYLTYRYIGTWIFAIYSRVYTINIEIVWWENWKNVTKKKKSSKIQIPTHQSYYRLMKLGNIYESRYLKFDFFNLKDSLKCIKN